MGCVWVLLCATLRTPHLLLKDCSLTHILNLALFGPLPYVFTEILGLTQILVILSPSPQPTLGPDTVVAFDATCVKLLRFRGIRVSPFSLIDWRMPKPSLASQTLSVFFLMYLEVPLKCLQYTIKLHFCRGFTFLAFHLGNYFGFIPVTSICLTLLIMGSVIANSQRLDRSVVHSMSLTHLNTFSKSLLKVQLPLEVTLN